MLLGRWTKLVFPTGLHSGSRILFHGVQEPARAVSQAQSLRHQHHLGGRMKDGEEGAECAKGPVRFSGSVSGNCRPLYATDTGVSFLHTQFHSASLIQNPGAVTVVQ